MSRPVIALLTDFGETDHYVGTMKGVALGICPEAALVDITHEIPPHDILDAALQLEMAVPYFPAGSVFLVVVDPGVGGRRRGLAAAIGDHRFVAPDNGVLTAVLQSPDTKKVVELSERRYFRPTVSRTFEGRDRFAPAAAWLARGIAVTALGRGVTDPELIAIPAPEAAADRLSGCVLRVDRFGNAITNIDRATFERWVDGDPIDILAGSHPIGRLVGTYAEIGQGEVCALFGSQDRLELAAFGVSAAAALGLVRHDPVTIVRRPA